MKFRKETALDTLQLLLTELEIVNVMAGSTASTEEGRALILATASLVKRAEQLARGIPDAKEEDALGCTVRTIEIDFLCKDLSCIFWQLMKHLLNQTLTAYAHCIRSSAAQRTFEQCFPRLTIKSSVGAGREEGEKVALEAPVCVVSIISASTNQNDRTRILFLGGI